MSLYDNNHIDKERQYSYLSQMKCDCDNCEIKSIFYATIKESEVEEYCKSRIEKEVKTGELIIRQGDYINDFIYLKEGLVKLYRDTPHGQQIISLGKPLDFVSLLSVFGNDTYSYSVSAINDSVICILSIKEIRQLIHENGDFALKIISTLNKASERILFDHLDLSQKRLNGRVASVLLYFADVFGMNKYELPITRKEIAQLIGMSIENVIRAISEFRRDNILNVYGKRIEIVDITMLRRIRDLN